MLRITQKYNNTSPTLAAPSDWTRSLSTSAAAIAGDIQAALHEYE